MARKALDDKLRSLQEKLRVSATKLQDESSVPSLPLELVTRIVSFVPRVARIGGRAQEEDGDNRNGQITNWLPHQVDHTRRPIVEIHKDIYPALPYSILDYDDFDFRVHLDGFWEPEKLAPLIEEPIRWKELVMECRNGLEAQAVLIGCILFFPAVLQRSDLGMHSLPSWRFRDRGASKESGLKMRLFRVHYCTLLSTSASCAQSWLWTGHIIWQR